MLYFYHYRFEPRFSNFTSQYAMFVWYLPCSAKKWGNALGSDLVVCVCPRLESFHLAMGENYLCVHISKVWLLYGFSPQARFSEIKSKQTNPEWIAYNSFTARKKHAKRRWPHSVIYGEEQAWLLLMKHKKTMCTSAFVPLSWESSTSDCLLMLLL